MKNRCQRGLTLVELLIVMVITALLASAIGYAFTAELTLQRVQEARRADQSRSAATEREITRLLQGAKLSVADAPVEAPASPEGAPASPEGAAAEPTRAAEQTTYFLGVADSGASDLGCDRLTFTTTAPGVPLAALGSADDFETQQSARGPVGGLAEVSLGTAPVGEAGERTGLFERLQRPADADPRQGGFESVLDPQIARIGFQFWDGQSWDAAWPVAGPPRLPGAVRVSYTLRGQPESDVRVFVVPIPASDVDAQNPITAEGNP